MISFRLLIFHLHLFLLDLELVLSPLHSLVLEALPVILGGSLALLLLDPKLVPELVLDLLVFDVLLENGREANNLLVRPFRAFRSLKTASRRLARLAGTYSLQAFRREIIFAALPPYLLVSTGCV